MNYDLCKKLKDAGFPMKLATTHSQNYVGIFGGEDTGGTVYEKPTLSELIDACGDRFIKIQRIVSTDKIWWDCPRDFASNDFTPTIYSTPEEAVAHLWLALQENKKEK